MTSYGNRVEVDADDLRFLLDNARPPEKVPQYAHLAAMRLRADLDRQHPQDDTRSAPDQEVQP